MGLIWLLFTLIKLYKSRVRWGGGGGGGGIGGREGGRGKEEREGSYSWECSWRRREGWDREGE